MGHINLLFTSITLLLILPVAFSAEEYQTAGLDEHNKHRKDHGVDDLTMNEELNEVAVKCAEYYAGINKINHQCPDRKKQSLGENLYWASDRESDPTVHTKRAIRGWYAEIDYYDWENPDCTKGKGGKAVGHFTQLVWKASKELGVGFVQKGDAYFFVALYNPPGNIRERESENVLPKNGTTTVAPNHAPQSNHSSLAFLVATFFTLTCTTLQLKPM